MRTRHTQPSRTAPLPPVAATFTVASCGDGRREVYFVHEEEAKASSYGIPAFYASVEEARRFAADILSACDAAERPATEERP
jgi:hypothetical protein